MNKKLLLLFLLAFAAVMGKATHITHGNVYYEYMGKDTNNDNLYQVSIVVYRDCQVSTVPFDEEIEFGVYRKNKLRFKALNAVLTDTTAVVPFSLSNNADIFCFRKARYVTMVSLPPDTAGYHVVWHRCCRRDITNITNDNSSAYYAFIPGQENNSPISNFENIITMRAGKWYAITAINTDKDGDSLTYSLTAPLNGQASAVEPTLPPPSSITIPVSTINYNNGFSAQNPFGTNSKFIVHEKNGAIKLFCASQGIYMVGIKVSEWRNGVLLAEYYRETVFFCTGTATQGEEVLLNGNTVGMDKIQLTWLYVINQSVNNIVLSRRTEHDTTWKQIGLFDSTVFSYIDTAVEYDSLYWYRVTVNAHFTTEKSNIIRIAISPDAWPTGINTPATPVFTAYPNPVNDRLFINDEKNSLLAVIIADINGRTLYETVDIEEIKTKGLHTGFLPAGIYVLQAITPNGMQTFRIIKE